MRFLPLIFSILIIALSYPVFADAQNTSFIIDTKFAPGQVIIKFKQGAMTRDMPLGIEQVNKRFSVNQMKPVANEKISIDDAYIIKVSDVMKAVETYKKDPTVEYAEPNYLAQIVLTPNDPSFSNQYHHATVQDELAWNITTGNSSVIIAIIDTGVEWNHSDCRSGDI